MRIQRLTLPVTLFALLLTGFFVFEGCNKDPCKDVTCNDNGTPQAQDDECICDCDLGYEGKRCDSASYKKFTGTYDVEDVCNDTTTYTYESTVKKGSSNTDLLIKNLGGFQRTIDAKLSSSTEFNIPDQTDADDREWSGSGSYNNGKVEISYTVTFSDGSSDNCDATYTLQ